MCHIKYVRAILASFGMDKNNSVQNPIVSSTKLTKNGAETKVDETLFKQVVGSLMYFIVTRLDLIYELSLISKFMSYPNDSHWLAAKRLLKYVKGTIEFGILIGFVFLLSSGIISWSFKKQHGVTLFIIEVKSITTAYCVCQCVWLRRVLEKLSQRKE